jgi:hypothetical protein
VRKKDQKADIPKEAQKMEAASKPTTVQIIDTIHNFGQVQEGAIVEFSYRFRNTGKEPLVILEAKASCGCTVPEKPEKPILPGEIGYLKVKFDSKDRPGQVQKTVTVTSNAEPPFPALILEGDVIGKKQ